MLRSERGQATADLRRCRAENAKLRAAAAEAGAEAQPVEILQNTFSDRTHCIAQLRPGSSFLLSVLRFLDRIHSAYASALIPWAIYEHRRGRRPLACLRRAVGTPRRCLELMWLALAAYVGAFLWPVQYLAAPLSDCDDAM